MKHPAETKQVNDSFIAFLGSHHAWPVWALFFYLAVAFGIAMLTTAAGLAFAAMQRPEMPLASKAVREAQVTQPAMQHK